VKELDPEYKPESNFGSGFELTSMQLRTQCLFLFNLNRVIVNEMAHCSHSVLWTVPKLSH